ncbi:MAG: COX15/CtaA family protein [Bryobacteraceae bacterium]
MQLSGERVTTAGAVPVRLSTTDYPAFAKFAWGVLAYNILVILWGALVRATGSGAGCGGHWPLCNGDVVPQVSQVATAIEFTHRIMSGVALIVVVSMFAWARKALPTGHHARKWAGWSLVFILTEALLGAALVLLGHVANDQSTGRVYSLTTHLINTFLLLASMALTAWWATISSADPRHAAMPVRKPLNAWTIGALVVIAVAGAITALGDTLFPPQTLAQGFAEDFATASNFLVRLRVIHPALAVVASALIAALAFPAWRSGKSKASRVLGGMLLCLVIAQVAAGTLTILLRAPVAMQLTHLLIADCLWISLVLFSSENLRQNG